VWLAASHPAVFIAMKKIIFRIARVAGGVLASVYGMDPGFFR
jgi:hypothetical protein